MDARWTQGGRKVDARLAQGWRKVDAHNVVSSQRIPTYARERRVARHGSVEAGDTAYTEISARYTFLAYQLICTAIDAS